MPAAVGSAVATSVQPFAGFRASIVSDPRAARTHLPVQVSSTAVSPDGTTISPPSSSSGGSPLGVGIPLTVLLARE